MEIWQGEKNESNIKAGNYHTHDVYFESRVTVIAEQTTENIDFQLVLGGGEITGAITNTSGNPIRDLRVVCYEAASGRFISNGWTQVDGTYSVRGLPSGSYKVYVARYYTPYIPEYYDDAPDLGSATPVAVTNGLTTAGINFVLETGGVEADSDNDGLPDAIENGSCTDPNDADTDDDGIIDGDEDENQNGFVDPNETDPCNIDSDGDGIQDGTELGVVTGHSTDTGGGFIPDADGGATTTDPLEPDSDDDGFSDGVEDKNLNGQIDPGESDPNNAMSRPTSAMPWIPL
ncbi:MAG: carboxypeptidase regulatory-like domain-containing protein, partial [Deltaproteobacteria bacterium]|nr:carboxypeptidase regulatory-like domain-containing protein [Deltaproteobacteria bacterium]